MEKIDARKHSPKTQFEIRKQVVRLRKKGIANNEIAEGLGISASRASIIWHQYLKHGSSAIKLGKRGRSKGEKRTLSSQQEIEIQKAIIDKNPKQLKLNFALWTRDAVRLYIKSKYRIDMPIRTVGEYLKRWGFTPQKPAKRAYEQKPQAVQKWLKEDYPAIAARAKKEKAQIHWGDETGIQNDAYNARGFAPKGQTPIIEINVKRNKINMISAITNQGKVRFMMYKETMTSKLLIKFMVRLIQDTDKKVFLILDNLRSHHSREVAEWLKNKKNKIEVFFLPPYSPELNPDEYLNGDLKTSIRSGIPPRSQSDIEGKTRSFMRTLLKRPQHVKNYFKHPVISYAA